MCNKHDIFYNKYLLYRPVFNGEAVACKTFS